MKKLSIFLLLPFWVEAQTHYFVENRNTINIKTVSPTFHSFVSHDFNQKWGMWSYLLVKDSWAEGFLGGSYNVTPDCQLGLGYGYEQTADHHRIAGSLFFSKDKNTVFYFGETGASGYWYQAYYSRSLGKKFGLGVIGQKFVGYGPRLEVKFLPVVIWGSYCYDVESKSANGLLALRVKF
jgi:hypothetical protein